MNELRELSKLGLTDGELRVYRALLELGQVSTGPIMKAANISSSKVYLILARLIEKGLVRYTIFEKTRYYTISGSQAIMDLAEEKIHSANQTKTALKKILPFVESRIRQGVPEETTLYKGIRGIRTAYLRLIEDLSPGDTYYFFAVTKDEIKKDSVLQLFSSIHRVRIRKKVRVKSIAHPEVFRTYKKLNMLGKYAQMRAHEYALPTGIVISKNRILNIVFTSEYSAFEMISPQLAKRYQEYFMQLWKTATK